MNELCNPFSENRRISTEKPKFDEFFSGYSSQKCRNFLTKGGETFSALKSIDYQY